MYNLNQLIKYSEKFLMDNYNIKLNIPITLNARLKTVCGRFVSIRNRKTGESKAKCVELNKYFVENNEPSTVLDVLRHELVHYALFALGKPNKDGHPVFERELKRLKIVSQSTINTYKIAVKPVKKSVSLYKCAKCGHIHTRHRALPDEGIHHRCSCKGRLIHMGKKIVSAK